ncbi:MAG: T9SS type A sorting domain-containing protein, partial [Phycisphaerae bacterium]|nr:T9SS type A sorting domain-containing protein [Saprospiraceae bacterium]
PNPTNDLLFITCQGSSTSSVQVIDNLGKVIFKDNAFVPDGTLRTISLKKMPSGSYYVRIVGDGFARTIPVIKN